MAGCAVRGHINTAIRICEDRVNKDNVDLAISEFEDFCNMAQNGEFDENKHLGEFTKIIYDIVKNIKKQLKQGQRDRYKTIFLFFLNVLLIY